jgi:nitrate reductase gamma subunit
MSFSATTSDMSLSISDIVVVSSSASAPAVSSASTNIVAFVAEAGGDVCSIACITFIIRRFFCRPAFSSVDGADSFDYKRLVRSNLRGLSSANGMDSIITF